LVLGLHLAPVPSLEASVLENVHRIARRQNAVGNRIQDRHTRPANVIPAFDPRHVTGAILSRMIFAAVMSPLRAA
jgi:hypothetical protein